MKNAAKDVMNRPADRGRKIRRATTVAPDAAHPRFFDRDDLE